MIHGYCWNCIKKISILENCGCSKQVNIAKK